MKYVKLMQVNEICKVYAFSQLVGWFEANGNFIKSKLALITPGIERELEALKKTWK